LDASVGIYCSNPERAGRDGFLTLRFERRGPSTFLGQCRFTLPLQALTPLILEDGTAYLTLLNPTGGVFGGDRLITNVVLETNAHVCLTTTSATRIYRALHDPAVQETTIQVADGATLEYLPEHMIPHAGSALRQKLRVELAQTSRAVILDSFASGRVAHGERWKFKELDLQMEVMTCNKPTFINRMKIVPAEMPPQQFGLMDEFNYMTCMGVFAAEFDGWPQMAAEVHAQLRDMPDVVGGVSLISRGGCVVKYMANSAADLTEANKKLWSVARELVIRLPVFDPRKF